jgi:hypothetical protein
MGELLVLCKYLYPLESGLRHGYFKKRLVIGALFWYHLVSGKTSIVVVLGHFVLLI